MCLRVGAGVPENHRVFDYEELGGWGLTAGWAEMPGSFDSFTTFSQANQHVELLSPYRETRMASPLNKLLHKVPSRTWKRSHHPLFPVFGVPS